MLRNFYERPALLFGSVFLGFSLLTWIVAVGPALDAQASSRPLPASKPLTSAEQRGLEVYLSEGCPTCHTQQVRSAPIDAVWGRPTVAADYARLKPISIWQGTPGVPGSARTGPDLSDIGNRQPSQDWQLIHLYNPRALVSWSVMPAFPWLFTETAQPAKGSVVVPVPRSFAPENRATKIVASERALDLAAYLAALRQPPLPGAATSAPSATTSAGGKGEQLYATNCAACHQANGEGVPATFPALKADPVVNDADATRHIATVIHGMSGQEIAGIAYPVAMPPFGTLLNDEQIADIVNHERVSWGNRGTQVSAKQVAEVRASGVKP